MAAHEKRKKASAADSPSEAEDGGRLWQRLFRLFVAYALGAMAMGSVIYVYGLELTSRQATIGLGIIAPVSAISVLAVGVVLLRRHFRPLARFYGSARQRQTPALAKAALIRAVNLPLLSCMRVILGQGPIFMLAVSLSILFANHWLSLGIEAWQWLVCMVGAVLVAIGHGMLEYFATVALLRPYVKELYAFAGGLTTADKGRLVALGMHRKLLWVSAFIVVIPLLVLGFTLLIRIYHLLSGLVPADTAALMSPLVGWSLLIILFTTLLAGVMSTSLARDMSASVGRLMRAMHSLGEGRLDVHLDAGGTDEFFDINTGFNRMVEGLREREKLREAFGHYVAYQLVDEVVRKDMRLAGRDVEASVLFADIRNFTALAGFLSAEQVIDLLNRYFTAVEPAIEVEGGWINKFGGDSLLAVFGVLQHQDDHEHHAVRAARKMRQALTGFNAKQRRAGYPEIRIGIGIHCGRMVAGTVGGKSRMEYTVVGDTVNTAARIQEFNKEWNTDILISDALRAAVPKLRARRMGTVDIRGKGEAMTLYAVK